MLASLVRNEVIQEAGGTCMVWGSLPKFKALMQTLACNYVFKQRPEDLKYMHKPKTLKLSPRHVPVCFSESKPEHWGGFGKNIAGIQAHNDWDWQGRAGAFCRNSTAVRVCRSHSLQLTSLILLSQAFYLHIFLSVCLFSLNSFTYTELKVFLEMLVWLLTARVIHRE